MLGIFRQPQRTATNTRGFATLGTAVALLSVMVLATLYRTQFAAMEQRILALYTQQQLVQIVADAVLAQGVQTLPQLPPQRTSYHDQGQLNGLAYQLHSRLLDVVQWVTGESAKRWLVQVSVQLPSGHGWITIEQQAWVTATGVRRIPGSWRDAGL